MGRLAPTIHLFFHVMETALQLETAVASRTTDRGSFITILILVLGSSALVNMASLLWIHKVMDFTGRRTGQVLCIILHVLQLGPLWRYFKLIVLAEGRDEEEFHTLRLSQVALQNAPFIIIQGYLLMGGKDSIDGVFSIVVAMGSLAFAISCYENKTPKNIEMSLHNKKTKFDPKYVIYIALQFLCHLFVLTSRFLASILFADKLQYWIILLLCGHFVMHSSLRCIMTLYSKEIKAKLKAQGMLLFGLETYIQVWDNLNVATETTVPGMLLIYLMFLIENVAMTLLWFLGRESSSRTVILMVLVFACLLLGCLLAVLVRQLVKNHCLCTSASPLKTHIKNQPKSITQPKNSTATCSDEELCVGDTYSDKHCFINSVFDLDFDPVPLTPTIYMSTLKTDNVDSITSVSACFVDVKPPSTLDGYTTSGQASISMEEHTSPDSGFLSLILPVQEQDHGSSVSRNTNTLDISTSSTGRDASSEASSSALMQSPNRCKHQQTKQQAGHCPPKHDSINNLAGRHMRNKANSSQNSILHRCMVTDKSKPFAGRVMSSSSEFTSENEISPVESGIHSSENSNSNSRRMCGKQSRRGTDNFDWVCDDVTCTSDSSDSYYYTHRRPHHTENVSYGWEDSCSDSYSDSFCYTYDYSSSSSSSTNTYDIKDSEIGCALTWPPRKRITIVNLGNLPKEQVSVHDNVSSWLSQTQTFSPNYQPTVQGRRALREACMRQTTQGAMGSGLVTQNCYRRACSLRAKRRTHKPQNATAANVTYLADKRKKKRHILLTLCSIRTKKSTRYVDLLKRDQTGNITDQLITNCGGISVDKTSVCAESCA